MKIVTRHTRLRLLLVLLAVTAGVTVGMRQYPAGAGIDRSGVLDPEVQAILQDYPQATWTTDGTIELEPGMELLLPVETNSPAEARAAAVEECEYGYLCVYEHINFGGVGARVQGCRWYPLPDSLKNQVSSLINNQRTGTVAWFYDAAPRPHLRFGEEIAYGYRMDMRLDRAPDGGTWNNRMDYADVLC